MSSRNSTRTSNTKPSAAKTSNTKPSATKAKTPRNTTSPGPAKTPRNTTSPGPSRANTPTKARSPVRPRKVKNGREALLQFVKEKDIIGTQVIDGIPVDEIVDLELSGMITEGDFPLVSMYKQHDLLNEQKDHLLSSFTIIEKTLNPLQLHNQMKLACIATDGSGMFSVAHTHVRDLLEGTKQAHEDNQTRLSEYMLGNTSNSGNAILNSCIQMRKQLEDYKVYYYALPKGVIASADHWQFHGKNDDEYRLFTGVTSEEKIYHCPITGADHKRIVYTASWVFPCQNGDDDEPLQVKDSDAESSSEEEEDADMIRLRQNFRNIKTDEDDDGIEYDGGEYGDEGENGDEGEYEYGVDDNMSDMSEEESKDIPSDVYGNSKFSAAWEQERKAADRAQAQAAEARHLKVAAQKLEAARAQAQAAEARRLKDQQLQQQKLDALKRELDAARLKAQQVEALRQQDIEQAETQRKQALDAVNAARQQQELAVNAARQQQQLEAARRQQELYAAHLKAQQVEALRQQDYVAFQQAETQRKQALDAANAARQQQELEAARHQQELDAARLKAQQAEALRQQDYVAFQQAETQRKQALDAANAARQELEAARRQQELDAALKAQQAEALRQQALDAANAAQERLSEEVRLAAIATAAEEQRILELGDPTAAVIAEDDSLLHGFEDTATDFTSTEERSTAGSDYFTSTEERSTAGSEFTFSSSTVGNTFPSSVPTVPYPNPSDVPPAAAASSFQMTGDVAEFGLPPKRATKRSGAHISTVVSTSSASSISTRSSRRTTRSNLAQQVSSEGSVRSMPARTKSDHHEYKMRAKSKK